MTSEYSSTFARFYDLIYQHLRDAADHDFFINKIKGTKGPVLEVGVGTGRFFIDAINTGADIYGIDISPAMVDVLKQKLNPSQHFRVSVEDICTFSHPKRFSLIVAPFRVFMHLTSVEQQLQALQNIHHHLSENGLFIFDAFIPDLKVLMHGIEEKTDFEGEYQPGETVKRIVWSRPVNHEQLLNLTMRFVYTEKGEEHVHDWNAQLKYFHRFELEHLVKRSPLKLEKICGDYNENPIDACSKDYVVFCRK